jgi:hypothetical protein
VGNRAGRLTVEEVSVRRVGEIRVMRSEVSLAVGVFRDFVALLLCVGFMLLLLFLSGGL